MSIIIKDMEMPTSCWDCEVGGAKQMDNATCPFYSMEYWEQENYQDKIADGCPLVPVPPHGRLIDADALRCLYDPHDYGLDGEQADEYDRYHVSLPVIRQNIDDMPTIIPASEEGET